MPNILFVGRLPEGYLQHAENGAVRIGSAADAALFPTEVAARAYIVSHCDLFRQLVSIEVLMSPRSFAFPGIGAESLGDRRNIANDHFAGDTMIGDGD